MVNIAVMKTVNHKPDLPTLIARAGGLTVVAAKVGARENTVRNWIAEWQRHQRLEKISVTHLFRLAEALDCDVHTLAR